MDNVRIVGQCLFTEDQLISGEVAYFMYHLNTYYRVRNFGNATVSVRFDTSSLQEIMHIHAQHVFMFAMSQGRVYQRSSSEARLRTIVGNGLWTSF